MDPEIGCLIQDEPIPTFYIRLKPSLVPPGWRNDPYSLVLDSYFHPADEESYVSDLKRKFGMPNPIPVIYESSNDYHLFNGGDGKYYVWEPPGDMVLELFGRDLAKIVATFRLNRAVRGTTFRQTGTLCNINPDYADPWMCCNTLIRG